MFKVIDRSLFSHLARKDFIVRSIFFSLVGDLSYLSFLHFVFLKHDRLAQMLKSYKMIPEIDLFLQDPALMMSLQSSFQKIFWILFTAVIGLNVVAYIFYWFHKSYGIKYMRSLSLTGLIFSIPTVFEAQDHGSRWMFMMVLMVPLYFYLYRGTRYYYSSSALPTLNIE